MKGIYIHVPFCVQKCSYCDFCSYPKELSKIKNYFIFLKKEILLRSFSLKDKTFQTIYFGGGTPSLVEASYIESVMQILKDTFQIDKDAEITIEINPGTLTKEKVEVYKKCGINRFSVGLQTANDLELKKLNRIHKLQDYLDALDMLKGENVSTDILIGLHNQDKADLKHTIDVVKNASASHISMYALTVEDGTPIYSEYLNGDLPSEDEIADLYDFGKDYLEENGYHRYEVSNFAKDGYLSRHNLNYWQRGEYIGFGVSAHSFINGRRFSNTEYIDDYIKCLNLNKFPEIFSEEIADSDGKFEYIMLGLRTSFGVDKKAYKRDVGSDLMEDFKAEIAKEYAYLEIDENRMRIKDEFLYLQNNILIEFLK